MSASLTRGLLEALLWAEYDETSNVNSDVSFDALGLGVDDFDAETLKNIETGCAHFCALVAASSAALATHRSGAGIDSVQAGHDLFLTARGHGAGFWDGDWGCHGSVLSRFAKEVFMELEHSHIHLHNGKVRIE